MDGLTNVLQINYTDHDINTLIKEPAAGDSVYTTHFSGNEELFIRFDDEFTVPHLPIHHDVRNTTPGTHYLGIMKSFLTTLFHRASGVFSGLTYFFDPEEVFKPGFFKLYKVGKREFLYLLRLDLLYNPQYGRIIERGDNDVTPVYGTKELFLQAYILPLEKVDVIHDKIKAFHIKQTISETWIGEQGRGYLVKGIWIDDELTKFYTKLFLPAGKKIYPYFPFLCMYKTLCANIIGLTERERENVLPYFSMASTFLYPYMKRIEKALKNTDFSENLPLFQEIKEKVPPELYGMLNNLHIEAYLNRDEIKEYEIELDA
ncbi:MAG: hypothetical protein JXJ04_25895 [Spirochaetales bacterium]|nr:hypothetical protein [Spirochaetales bacterium]